MADYSDDGQTLVIKLVYYGPALTGKTTTLYSLLQQDATPEKNYVTIEDPV